MENNGSTYLSEVLYELQSAKRILEGADCDFYPVADREDVMAFLIKIALEKIEYYEAKYDFKVPKDDIFLFDEVIKFARESEKFQKEFKARLSNKTAGQQGGEAPCQP